MKKIISISFSIIFVLGLATEVFSPGVGQHIAHAAVESESQVISNPAPLKVELQAEPEDLVSFRRLGLSEEFLYGPYDSTRVRFSPPMTWKLQEGAELNLIITAYEVMNDAKNAPVYTGGAIAGSLNVTFNNQLITTLVLQSGQNVIYKIPIPLEALKPTRLDGRHELFLFLDASVDCDYDYHHTTAVIEPESAFLLPHDLIGPPVELSHLPKPFFQSGAFQVDPAVIVVPDQLTMEELRAAMSVAAGFGRLTGGRLPLSLTTESQLTQDVRKASNLIFVGKDASLPSLAEADLPATAGVSGAQAEDGVIQIAQSPWEPSKVVLSAGGSYDTGVLKAALALSTGFVQLGARSDLSVVAEVQADAPLTAVPVDRTLADLGYSAETVTGVGTNEFFYEFFFPPGQTSNEDAYFEIHFSHSDLLNYGRSGGVVLLNGQPIGSLRLDDDNSKLTKERIYIPASLLLPGNNQLSVRVELTMLDFCATFAGDELWFTVFPESTLHIPLAPASVLPLGLRDLGNYPYPFIRFPNLNSLAFVLPQSNLSAWQIATQVVFQMGARANAVIYEPMVIYADQANAEALKDYDAIMVGMFDELPVLAEINQQLPAPFDAESGLASQKGSRVIYRVPQGTSLGYLELLASPWNSANTVLVVLGSTPEGLVWSGAGLTVPALRNQICGDFSILQDERVVCSDSRTGAGTGSIVATLEPGAQQEIAQTTPAVAQSPGQESSPPLATRKDWILPVVLGMVALMILIFGAAIVSSSRSRGKQ